MTIGFGRLVPVGLVLLGIGVVADEDQPGRIGRPLEVAGAALARGEPARLAALPAEDRDLPAGGLVVVAALPPGDEGNRPAVGAEAGLRFARRAGRQADVLGARPVRQPDVAFVLVAGDVGEPEIAQATQAPSGAMSRSRTSRKPSMSATCSGRRARSWPKRASGARRAPARWRRSRATASEIACRGPRENDKSCHGCGFRLTR